MKTCNKCGIEKPLDAFTPESRNRGGRMHTCKACRSAEARERWKDPAYAARNNALRKEWHQKHYRMRRYGITWDEYHKMFASQGETCRLCRSADAGRGYEWCIDHCHKTGRVRGILCHRCNTSLGHYEKLCDTIGEAAILAYLHPDQGPSTMSTA